MGVLGPGVGCAVDLQVFAVLSSTGWRLSVRDLKRLAIACYLLLLLVVVALAATVLPLVRQALQGPGSEAKLLLTYAAANVYWLLAFAARESLTRRQALPCGAARVDYLRAVDLLPEAVCKAYLVVSVLPALAIVFVVDLLVVGFLAPAAGLDPIGLLSLILVPVAGALLAVAVVGNNAAAGPWQETRQPGRLLALSAVAALASGAGLRLLAELLSGGPTRFPRLPEVSGYGPYLLLGAEAVVTVLAVAVIVRARRLLRSEPHAVMRPARATTVRRGLPARGVESTLPVVLWNHLAGTPYGRLVGRLTLSAYLFAILVGGAWLVDGSVLIDGALAQSAGKLLVFAAFMAAIAGAELVLLSAGPAVLRRHLRQMWETGARATAMACWAVASYVLVPTAILAGLSVAGALAFGAEPWSLLAIGPTVAAAGLLGQALGRSDALDATPTEVPALTAVIALLLSAPCLYLALYPSPLALLGELCYMTGLIIIAVAAVRLGILRRSTAALQPLSWTA